MNPQKNTQKVITFNTATLPTTSISFNMFSKQIRGTDKNILSWSSIWSPQSYAIETS